MGRFHVNPATGNPGACRASKRCPFGGPEEHFGSREEARAAYEAAQATPLTSAVSKSRVFTASEVEALVPGFSAENEASYTLEEVPVSELSDGILTEDLPDDYDEADEASIQALEQAYRRGDKLPPLVAGHDEIFGGLELIDGNHRVNAAARAGLSTVPCFVEEKPPYSWPEHSETRKFKTARGEVTFQISDKPSSWNPARTTQAWLTVPGEGNVAFIALIARDEKYCPEVGEHLAMCDIETRMDARKKGYAKELREAIEKETGLLIYSSGSFTPEGWDAFGEHVRTLPNPYASEWDKPGVKFNSMGFVASWKHMVPRNSDRGIDYTDEQRDAMWELSEAGVFRKLEDKEILWVEE